MGRYVVLIFSSSDLKTSGLNVFISSSQGDSSDARQVCEALWTKKILVEGLRSGDFPFPPEFPYRRLMHGFVTDCIKALQLLLWEPSGRLIISELDVNLWLTARSELGLYVYEADNSWRRRRLAVIQSTQQMASVWLTAAVTSLRKPTPTPARRVRVSRTVLHPSSTSDSLIHSAFLGSELLRSSGLSRLRCLTMIPSSLFALLELKCSHGSHHRVHLVAVLELLLISHNLPQQMEFVQSSWNWSGVRTEVQSLCEHYICVLIGGFDAFI